jgi:hypothetical protein
MNRALVRCRNDADLSAGVIGKQEANMTSNLKIILSAIGVAALLASPAMAKSHVRHHNAHHTVYLPNDAYGSVVAPHVVAPSPASPGYDWDRDHDPRENPQD